MLHGPTACRPIVRLIFKANNIKNTTSQKHVKKKRQKKRKFWRNCSAKSVLKKYSPPLQHLLQLHAYETTWILKGGSGSRSGQGRREARAPSMEKKNPSWVVIIHLLLRWTVEYIVISIWGRIAQPYEIFRTDTSSGRGLVVFHCWIKLTKLTWTEPFQCHVMLLIQINLF